MKKRFRIPIIGLICCLLLGTIADTCRQRMAG